MKFSHPFIIGFLLLLSLFSLFLATGIGSSGLFWFMNGAIQHQDLILFDIRLPRVLVAFSTGLGLAVAGASLQGLLRNPMADPYILGTSAGAALGASCAIIFLGGSFLFVLAFIGAIIATIMIFSIAKTNSGIQIETLLLTGIALSMFFSAILSFMMYIAGTNLHQIMFWLMGGFWMASWADIWSIGAIICLSVGIMFFSRDLNIISLGEDEAAGLGVETELVKHVLLGFTSLIVAFSVSIAGSIGFIGLITPHIMRLVVGPDHRILIPASALAGGLLLLWADTCTRTLAHDMPVGIITAFFGAPFFIYLIKRRRTF